MRCRLQCKNSREKNTRCGKRILTTYRSGSKSDAMECALCESETTTAHSAFAKAMSLFGFGSGRMKITTASDSN